jgi:hypothetical protein
LPRATSGAMLGMHDSPNHRAGGANVFESISGLKLDYWYKVFVALGVAGLIASATVELHGIANSHALLLSLGLFLVGTGEWINHPFQTVLVPPNAAFPGYGQLTGHPRRNSALGVGMLLAGLACTAVAIYKIAQAT